MSGYNWRAKPQPVMADAGQLRREIETLRSMLETTAIREQRLLAECARLRDELAKHESPTAPLVKAVGAPEGATRSTREKFATLENLVAQGRPLDRAVYEAGWSTLSAAMSALYRYGHYLAGDVAAIHARHRALEITGPGRPQR